MTIHGSTCAPAPLPPSRGPLTEALSAALRGDPALDADLPAPVAPDDALVDDDLQLALWLCYELHYRGLDGVSDDWEWHPSVLRFRARLEDVLLADLRRRVEVPAGDGTTADRLWQMVRNDDGPSIARRVHRHATREQVRELMALRSVYQLKEADPHTWGIPRLGGAVKAALVEIQGDEYGQGHAGRMHSELFAVTLRGLGLDDAYGHYVAAVPGVALAITNVISLFGLHRSLVGALTGHLAAYEMTSSDPARRTAAGLRRLGYDDDTVRFFDEHVTADALHEQVASHDLCGGLAAARPDLAEQIVFGAAVSLYVDRRGGEHVLGAWDAGSTALREPLTAALAATA